MEYTTLSVSKETFYKVKELALKTKLQTRVLINKLVDTELKKFNNNELKKTMEINKMKLILKKESKENKADYRDSICSVCGE